MAEESFVCYNSFRIALNRFKWTPLFEKAVDALFNYWCFWIAPDNNEDLSILVMMDTVMPIIDAAKARREKNSAIRSEAGKKWWEAKSIAMQWNQNARKDWDIVLKQNKTEQNATNRTKQNVNVNVNVNDNVNDNDNINDKEKEIKEKEKKDQLMQMIRAAL